jgi:hypothetical protein
MLRVYVALDVVPAADFGLSITALITALAVGILVVAIARNCWARH